MCNFLIFFLVSVLILCLCKVVYTKRYNEITGQLRVCAASRQRAVTTIFDTNDILKVKISFVSGD